MERHLISKRFQVFVLSLLLSPLLLSGCTRKMEEHAAVVRLSLPKTIQDGKVGDLVADTLVMSHVVINVSGAGINPAIFFAWDSHEGKVAPPGSFTITNIPSGTGRLVQVLVVYQDSVSGGDSFYYGSATSTISGDTYLTISVSQVTGGSVGEGQIAGRFLPNSTTPTFGPTGRVWIRYSPPGQPEMLVHSFEMFGGWFETFALENAQLNYVLENGQNLFGGPVGVETLSPAFYPGSGQPQQTMRLKVPLTYRTYGDPSGPRHAEFPARKVLGWFGPGATGKKVCYYQSGSPVDIPESYQTSSTSDPSVIRWNPSGSPASYDAYVEQITMPGDTSYYGGFGTPSLDATEHLCQASGTRFVDYISLDHNQVANHDGALAFQGPFEFTYNGGGTYRSRMVANFSAGSLNLTWKYLPFVGSSAAGPGVNGADVFFRILAAGTTNDHEYRDSDAVRCLDLVSKFGFNLLPNGQGITPNASRVSSITTSMTDPAFATAYNSGLVQFVVCPYSAPSLLSAKTYFTTVNEYRTYGGSGGGGGGGTEYFIKMSAASGTAGTLAGSPNTQAPSICKDYKLELVDSSGAAQSPSSSVTVSLMFQGPNNSSGMNFYSGSGCSGGPSSNMTISSATPAPVFSILTSASAGYYPINAQPSWMGSFNIRPDVLDFAVTSSPGVDFGINILAGGGSPSSSDLADGECYPVDVQLNNGVPPMSAYAGAPAYASSALSVSLSALSASISQGSFYSAANCSGTAITSLNLPAYQHSARVYFIPSGHSSSATYGATMTLTSLPGGYSAAGRTINVGSSNPVNIAYKVGSFTAGGSTYMSTACNRVYYDVLNETNALLHAISSGVTINFNVSSGDGTFFTDSSCTAQASGSPNLASISVGSSNGMPDLYFQPAWGLSNVTINANGTFFTSKSFNFPVAAVSLSLGASPTNNAFPSVSITPSFGFNYCLSQTNVNPSGFNSPCAGGAGSTNGWYTNSPPSSFSLSGGDGVKTVYLWVADGNGQIVGSVNAMVTLDTTGPLAPVLTLKDPADVNVSGGSTTWSGVLKFANYDPSTTHICFVNTLGSPLGSPPAPTDPCFATVVGSPGTDVMFGPESVISPPGTHYINVVAKDAVDNLSTMVSVPVTSITSPPLELFANQLYDFTVAGPGTYTYAMAGFGGGGAYFSPAGTGNFGSSGASPPQTGNIVITETNTGLSKSIPVNLRAFLDSDTLANDGSVDLQEAFGATYDPGNNYLYTVGTGFASSPGNNHWIVRRATVGGAWSTVDNFSYYDATGRDSKPYSVTMSGGFPVVAGFGTDSSALMHWTIRQFNGASWSNIDDYSLSPGYNSVAKSIASDGSSTIYAAGFGADSNGNHWLVRKWNGSSWALSENLQFSLGKPSVANGVATNGSVVIAAGAVTSSTNQKKWLVRKSTDGGTTWTDADLWSPCAGSEGNCDAEARSVAIDGVGNIFVAGYYTDTGGLNHWLVRQIAFGGAISQVDDYTFSGQAAEATAVAANPVTNEVLVGGFFVSSGTPIWMVKRYVPQPWFYMDQASGSVSAKVNAIVTWPGQYFVAGLKVDAGPINRWWTRLASPP